MAVELVFAVQRSDCFFTRGVFEAHPGREGVATAGDREVRSKDVAPRAAACTEITRELSHRVAHTRDGVLERRGDMNGSRREGEEKASAAEAELDGKRAAGYHDTIGTEHHGTSRECDDRSLESEMLERK